MQPRPGNGAHMAKTVAACVDKLSKCGGCEAVIVISTPKSRIKGRDDIEEGTGGGHCQVGK